MFLISTAPAIHQTCLVFGSSLITITSLFILTITCQLKTTLYHTVAGSRGQGNKCDNDSPGPGLFSDPVHRVHEHANCNVEQHLYGDTAK